MTKKEFIENSMIYTGQNNVKRCISYLEETLKSVTKNTINLINSKIVEPSVGSGSFYDELKYYDIISYDIIAPEGKITSFTKCNFLKVEEIKTDKKYKVFIGFPPIREYEDFVKHSFELNADVIAFIMPVSSVNKKNTKIYKENGYTVVFSKPIISDDFTLPNDEGWDFGGNFVIMIKDEYIKKELENKQGKTYKDFFEVYTINDTVLTIKETSQPNLFSNGKIPKNRRTGKPYKILEDESGNKYYHQIGINLDKIDECQLFLPLRVFPSKQEGMILYETFHDDTFAKIGFGLKLKDGYSVRKVKGKIIYYLYREMYKGIFTLVAKLDEEAVKNFYTRQRYNNGVFVSSKKLIEANKKGIL